MITISGLLGALTIFVAVVGTIFAWIKYTQFKKIKSAMSERLQKMFITDCLIYIITALFGIATFINVSADNVLYPLRILILASNIFFMYRLTKPFEDKK